MACGSYEAGWEPRGTHQRRLSAPRGKAKKLYQYQQTSSTLTQQMTLLRHKTHSYQDGTFEPSPLFRHHHVTRRWCFGQTSETGGGAVTISGGVKKLCKCGTSGHGLMAMTVLGCQLDTSIFQMK